MSTFLCGLGLVVCGYLIGFYMGVLRTHTWIESVAPGTSRHLIELDERQKRNQRR